MISFTLLRHVPRHDQMWRTQWCPYWGWQIGEKRLLLEFLSHFWDNCCWTHMKVTVQLGREGLDINLSHGQDIDRLQWQLLPMAVFGFKKKKNQEINPNPYLYLVQIILQTFEEFTILEVFLHVWYFGESEKNVFLLFIILKRFIDGKCCRV